LLKHPPFTSVFWPLNLMLLWLHVGAYVCMMQVGARLISHAGSLTSLAKYPASTVQILGAEKALFRWTIRK